jgi:pyruvate dehydrogenase E2 component (dihydrolipoamide acetyltransferase)
MTALWQLRTILTEQARIEGFDAKITPLALICRATVLALRRFPTLNARYDAAAGEIRLLEEIHLGVAVDTESGLMVPNVKHAERLSVLDFAEEAVALAERCRSRVATPEDLTGGTFTVNNYGSFGNDDGDPIINAPESAILGIGAIRERPWVVDGQLAVRRVARLKLVFDHRICDGGEAARFIDHLASLCEQPTRLLLHA